MANLVGRVPVWLLGPNDRIEVWDDGTVNMVAIDRNDGKTPVLTRTMQDFVKYLADNFQLPPDLNEEVAGFREHFASFFSTDQPPATP